MRALAMRADGTLLEGIEAQARQTMDNIGALLAIAGLSFAEAVRCMVMLGDIADWQASNRVYIEYFPADRLPTRSAFGVDGLALEALVEVEWYAFASETNWKGG